LHAQLAQNRDKYLRSGLRRATVTLHCRING